jgi:hypothetical protein
MEHPLYQDRTISRNKPSVNSLKSNMIGSGIFLEGKGVAFKNHIYDEVLFQNCLAEFNKE